MDSKSLDLAYNALGGTYLYTLALTRGIGLPSIMLDANDILCHGGPEMVTVLVDQLAKEQWDGFENPCFEPSVSFERTMIKALCKKDPRWKPLKCKLKRGLMSNPRIFLSENPKGFESLPFQAANELYRTGWQYMAQSQRVIFQKGISCMKIALDSDGFDQNFNEHIFLSRYGKSRNNHYVLKVTPSKEILVRVPEIYSFHPRHLWITRQWVDGDVPEIKAKDFVKIQESIMKAFLLEDIRPNNLLWDYKEKCYWIIDPGIPSRKSY